ncbi:uncharacterized protein LOC107043345 [Diachasma alloeum]|uniref:uncharacterized protein LOC107043345 n=1 Tax=Diachasma alloeum TaxID=454923 RepID=UPI0007382C30|nr:uncharacterized protein LOC107043345 [Diachasma alloeum]
MTACCGSYLSVKSSVYNQTGENFFQQLGVYNHMNTHLRRVLQAKCVVDSKNPRYVQRHDNYKYLRGEKCLHKCHSYDNITRSARNSQYHLIEMLQPSSGPTKGSTKSLASFKSQNRDKHSMNSRRNAPSRQELTSCKPTVHVIEPERPEVKPYPNDQLYSDYESSFEASTKASERGIPVSKEEKSSSPKREPSRSRKKQLENLKYLKFLHEITQEIIETGVHRDEEIKKVLKKHLTKNLSSLNKKKMLKKLRQLRSSLSISDEEDEDEQEIDSSTEKTYSSVEKNQSTTGRSERTTEASRRGGKSEENKSGYDSGDSDASQVSEESIEWQSEIESVINEEESTSERIDPQGT